MVPHRPRAVSDIDRSASPDGADARAAWPVAIVSMPFMDVDRPSIQLGLLKAIVEKQGFPVRTLHANLDLAARLGVETYANVAEHRGRMIGDWLFSVEAFGDAAPDPRGDLLLDAFGAELPTQTDTGESWRDVLLRIRDHDIPAYLDGLVDSFPWNEVRVVGFTCTFQQNTASFALARRLKRRHPHLLTVFGGANFDDEMGLEILGTVECVDLVVVGEGDRAFPELLDALATGSDPATVPGVARRRGDTVVAAPPAAPLRCLDELPVPDYAEFFERAEQLGLIPRTAHRTVPIPFEAARGCWWGQKHHCVFCGLNGGTMGFRAKSAGRVFDELAEQARRCRSFHFTAVDNILDPVYLRDLLPRLVESGTDYEIFYEVKANLTRAQLRLLAQAGVRRIQPGLESLSSPVLRLMRKGVRAAQNVNLLRWARYYGIHVEWNVLVGFPGEDAADYKEQAATLPHLVHLQPPSCADRIWMERFSPLFTDRTAFPVRYRRPEPSYRYVYPDGTDLDRIAYFFEYEFEDALPDSAYADLWEAVRQWQEAWAGSQPPVLTYWSAPGFLQIYDGRHAGHDGTYSFDGVLAEIYLACTERPASAPAIRRRLGSPVSVATVRSICAEFQRRGLMFLDGDRWLALAIPAVSGR